MLRVEVEGRAALCSCFTSGCECPTIAYRKRHACKKLRVELHTESGTALAEPLDTLERAEEAGAEAGRFARYSRCELCIQKVVFNRSVLKMRTVHSENGSQLVFKNIFTINSPCGSLRNADNGIDRLEGSQLLVEIISPHGEHPLHLYE
eukprot:scaffold795_cov94-Skeletonema_dohrnii-CCMP3373.AAC.2